MIVLIIMLISFCVIIFGFYIWLNLSLNTVISKDSYKELVQEIRQTPQLPERFYGIYSKVAGVNIKSSSKNHITERIFNILTNQSNYKNGCPCIDAAYIQGINSTIDTWIVGLALDKEVTTEQCFAFYLSHFDYLFSQIGIRNASKFYYNKEIEELNDDEMYEISVMTVNPAYFNKLRNSEKLK